VVQVVQVVRKGRVVLKRVRALLGGRQRAELDAEIRDHLESLAADHVRRGLSPADARAAARREFGGVDQIKEQYRDAAGLRVFDDFVRDVRYALRSARRNPVFTVVALLSIAIGVGVNCAAFSWADALLLRPLPISRPAEVVTVGSTLSIESASIGATLLRASYPEYVDLRERARSFEGFALFNGTTVGFAATAEATPTLAVGHLVNDDFFSVLGVAPVLGRTFRPDEGQVPGRDAVVILSHGLWRKQFGGDPNAIGREVRLNGIRFTVIGVLPASFTGIEPVVQPEFYAPIMMWPRLRADDGVRPLETRTLRYLTVKGRLRPGVNLTEARAELAAISQDLARAHPEDGPARQLFARTDLQDRTAELPPLLALNVMLITLAGAVLLVACANVAGLLTSRAPARAREMATRLAIGSGRMRLIGQLMTESLLFAIAGGVVGLGVAALSVRAFQFIRFPTDMSIGYSFRFDYRVALVGFALALGSVIVFGLLPALQASAIHPMTALKGAESDNRRHRMSGRGLLVVGQVAASVVLLVIASFIYRAFRSELASGPGYRIDHLLMATFDPGLLHKSDADSRQFYRALVERAGEMPGVQSIAMTTHVPMQVFNLDATQVVPEGYRLPAGKQNVLVVSTTVDEHYFDTMRIPIVRGRPFRVEDDAQRPRVVVINEVAAAHYWPGQDPIGKRFQVVDEARRSSSWATVVGIAKTSKYLFLAEPRMEYAYFPVRQRGPSSMTLLLATRGDPAAFAAPLRAIVRTLDPQQPMYNVQTMDDFYRISTVGVFTNVIRTVAAMGVMGLSLSLVGLYGLVAYSATRRTKEFGIRIALGATRRVVLRLVMQQGLALAIVGLITGLAASVGAGLLLERAFPDGSGVMRADNVSLMIVAPVVLLATLVAAYVPAYRASGLDPMVALRYE
jgi:predicted permease